VYKKTGQPQELRLYGSLVCALVALSNVCAPIMQADDPNETLRFLYREGKLVVSIGATGYWQLDSSEITAYIRHFQVKHVRIAVSDDLTIKDFKIVTAFLLNAGLEVVTIVNIGELKLDAKSK
jgi:hypothetical protein